MEKNMVFDLDGTLADDVWRLHLITVIEENGKKEWDKYHFEAQYDMPVRGISEAYRVFVSIGYRMIIVTGRPEKWKDQTVKWLKEQNLSYDDLLMRPDGDFTPAYKLKLQLLKQANITPENVILVFDNDERVVDAMNDEKYKAVLVRK